MKRLSFLLLSIATLAAGHPMGNFSMSHHARLEVTRRGVDLRYTLDLAELPTFDLLRSWKLERNSPRGALDAKAREEAQDWLSKLQITSDGKPIHPKLKSVDLAITDGAGNLPVARITALPLRRRSGSIAERSSEVRDVYAGCCY